MHRESQLPAVGNPEKIDYLCPESCCKVRILRIILFVLLFWAASEYRSETAGEFVGRYVEVDEADEFVSQPDFVFVGSTGCDAAFGAPQQPVRTLSRDTSHPRLSSGRLSKPLPRLCGVRVTGGWCAPVKCRSLFSRFADPVSRTYVRKLRRLLI